MLRARGRTQGRAQGRAQAPLDPNGPVSAPNSATNQPLDSNGRPLVPNSPGGPGGPGLETENPATPLETQPSRNAPPDYPKFLPDNPTLHKIWREFPGSEHWAAKLCEPGVKVQLQGYVSAINVILSQRGLTEDERTEKFHATLLTMLNYAKDKGKLPDTIISIKEFSAKDSWMGAYTSGKFIVFNAAELLENGEFNPKEIFTTLFHESGHVEKNMLSSDERRRVFGENLDYYMPGSIGLDAYKFQPIEAHADFMGSKAERVTEEWGKG